MADEGSLGTDNAPNALEVGNHHWPVISNYFEAHGASMDRFEHHAHDSLEVDVHRFPSFNKAAHDVTAFYHEPKGVPWCR